MNKRKHINMGKQTGFSLIEILVVMVIMATIMGIVANNIGKNKIKANIKAAEITISKLKMAAENFNTDLGYYPRTLNDLAEDNGDSNWLGPYAKKKELKDPWGEEFQYSNPGQNDEEFSISSFGNDRSPGGTKFDKDINSWEI
ncbi:MAG: type II secretion system major pseudopilin GspG [Xanthomonadales bacterium]|nr:type II secretion system major pseudopilin GspG [Xanthomonadales bacterium]